MPKNNNQLDAEFFGLRMLNNCDIINTTRPYFFIKLLPFATSLISVGLVFLWFNQEPKIMNILYNFSLQNKHQSLFEHMRLILLHIYKFLISKWYFDAIYNEFIVLFGFKHGYLTTFKSLDKGLLEVFGPYGLSKAVFFSAAELRKMHVGEAYYYAYFMIFFLIIHLITMHSIIYQ